MSLFVAST